MLMGCILFTLTENSFESLKNCLRRRHTGREWLRMGLAMKASRRRQREGNRKDNPYTSPQSGHRPCCKLRG